MNVLNLLIAGVTNDKHFLEMIRLMRISRKFPSCTQFLHTFKSSELDVPDYHKKPIDPHILSLVKKYDPDIFYSSHIELNKKPLTFKQRYDLVTKLSIDDYKERLSQAKSPAPSILVEKFVDFTESKEKKEPEEEPSSPERPSIVVDDELQAKNNEMKLHLAKSKLKILTEMGLRRSALEHELQSFPDNWMEDYETFDENDYLSDTQYGTPGKKLSLQMILYRNQDSKS